jgi:TetR/AcrR family transcriptional regulator, transcriptional repressor for nem operon
VSKGERTRERIIEQATAVFNAKGYAGASMSDIMAATGLNKGGIYNHFESKDALALASFDYAVEVLMSRVDSLVDAEATAPGKLLALLRVFAWNIKEPPFEGGCPLLNTAIEADDAHPELRDRVRVALAGLQKRVRAIVRDGVASGELRPAADADAAATVFVATLEGAVMLSNLYKDRKHMARAIDHLREFVETSLRAIE